MMKILLLITLFCVLNAVGSVGPSVDLFGIKLKQQVVQAMPTVGRIELDKIHVPPEVPTDAMIGDFSPNPPVGVISFSLDWMQAGKSKHAVGSAVVRIFDKVAIAKTPIRHGELFTAENTVFQEKELSRLSQTGYYSDLASLTQLRARGYIQANSILGANNTELPVLVASGQWVDLVHETNRLKMSVRVKALENGRMDQWIRLENPSTKRILRGRVSATGVASLR